MFDVKAPIPSGSFGGLTEMERRQAAYAFHRYQKHGRPYEPAEEMASTSGKRAKNSYVKSLESQHQELWRPTNGDFNKFEITQLSNCAKYKSNLPGNRSLAYDRHIQSDDVMPSRERESMPQMHRRRRGVELRLENLWGSVLHGFQLGW